MSALRRLAGRGDQAGGESMFMEVVGGSEARDEDEDEMLLYYDQSSDDEDVVAEQGRASTYVIHSPQLDVEVRERELQRAAMRKFPPDIDWTTLPSKSKRIPRVRKKEMERCMHVLEAIGQPPDVFFMQWIDWIGENGYSREGRLLVVGTHRMFVMRREKQAMFVDSVMVVESECHLLRVRSVGVVDAETGSKSNYPRLIMKLVEGRWELETPYWGRLVVALRAAVQALTNGQPDSHRFRLTIPRKRFKGMPKMPRVQHGRTRGFMKTFLTQLDLMGLPLERAPDGINTHAEVLRVTRMSLTHTLFMCEQMNEPHLDLSECTTLTTQELSALSIALRWTYWFRSLVIRDRMLDVNGWVSMLNMFAFNRSLRKLHLVNLRLQPSDFVELARALEHNKKCLIADFDFSRNRLLDEGATALANAIHTIPAPITHFRAGRCDMGNVGVANLLTCLCDYGRTLRTLDLSFASFGDRAMKALVYLLRDAVTLRELVLDACHVDVRLVVQRLISFEIALDVLDVSHMQIEEDVASAIAEYAIACQREIHVKMVGCNLSRQSIHLLTSMHGNNVLKLDLSENYVDTEIGFDIAHMMRVNSSLHTLVLDDVGLVDEHMCALLKIVTDQSPLHELSLSRNLPRIEQARLDPLRLDTAHHLHELFQHNSHLRSFTINGLGPDAAGRPRTMHNGMTFRFGPDMRSAFGVLAMNTTLEVLEIASNDIGNDGVFLLGQALKTNRSLLRINIDDNDVTLEGLKSVRTALHSNTKVCHMVFPKVDIRRDIKGMQLRLKHLVTQEDEARTQLKVMMRTGDPDGARRARGEIKWCAAERSRLKLRIDRVEETIIDLSIALKRNDARRQHKTLLRRAVTYENVAEWKKTYVEYRRSVKRRLFTVWCDALSSADLDRVDGVKMEYLRRIITDDANKRLTMSTYARVKGLLDGHPGEMAYLRDLMDRTEAFFAKMHPDIDFSNVELLQVRLERSKQVMMKRAEIGDAYRVKLAEEDLLDLSDVEDEYAAGIDAAMKIETKRSRRRMKRRLFGEWYDLTWNSDKMITVDSRMRLLAVIEPARAAGLLTLEVYLEIKTAMRALRPDERSFFRDLMRRSEAFFTNKHGIDWRWDLEDLVQHCHLSLDVMRQRMHVDAVSGHVVELPDGAFDEAWELSDVEDLLAGPDDDEDADENHELNWPEIDAMRMYGAAGPVDLGPEPPADDDGAVGVRAGRRGRHRRHRGKRAHAHRVHPSDTPSFAWPSASLRAWVRGLWEGYATDVFEECYRFGTPTYAVHSCFLTSARARPPCDVTLVTQCSLDRLAHLQRQAERWPGRLSVCVYIEAGREHDVVPLVRAVHAHVEKHTECIMDVSLLVGNALHADARMYDHLYPVNALRNVALDAAESELVFLLDVDFVPSAQLHASLVQPQVYEALCVHSRTPNKPTAFVVPAFELRGRACVRGAEAVPADMAACAHMHRVGELGGFHVEHFPRGHEPTDYARWFASPEPYAIDWHEYYEPYVIANRHLVPSYDERFRGYGMNKVQHLHHMRARGFALRVLPQQFVVSLPHAPSPAWEYTYGRWKDPMQKVRVQALYRRFKREVAADTRLCHVGERTRRASAAPPTTATEGSVATPTHA